METSLIFKKWQWKIKKYSDFKRMIVKNKNKNFALMISIIFIVLKGGWSKNRRFYRIGTRLRTYELCGQGKK